MNKKDNMQGKHILIVDDEELITEMYQQFLETVKCRVTICSNGKEALDAFQKNSEEFDLMLTDQSMPFLTGKELSKKILVIRPDFPIIITTGYNDLFSGDELASSGVKKILMKPVDINELFQVINRCLAG